jgi:antitoxin component YwqK of YwqJK toxin-antitoxin module
VTDLPIIQDSELDFESDLVYMYRGKPFTGVAYEESPTRGRSDVMYHSGLQDGLSRDWYPSGKVKSEMMFDQNDRHGGYRNYDEAGRVVEEGFYEYSVLVSRKIFDSAGNVVEEFNLDLDSGTGRILRRLRNERQQKLDG